MSMLVLISSVIAATFAAVTIGLQYNTVRAIRRAKESRGAAEPSTAERFEDHVNVSNVLAEEADDETDPFAYKSKNFTFRGGPSDESSNIRNVVAAGRVVFAADKRDTLRSASAVYFIKRSDGSIIKQISSKRGLFELPATEEEMSRVRSAESDQIYVEDDVSERLLRAMVKNDPGKGNEPA
jgi:hypothetical protein